MEMLLTMLLSSSSNSSSLCNSPTQALAIR
jgi:hypothetical protein